MWATRPRAAAVAVGFFSLPGRTPSTYAVDLTWSGLPSASRIGIRGLVVEITARWSRGRRPGLITLGVQTIFQDWPTRRSVKFPVYIHGAPSCPRSTDAVNRAVAVPPDCSIGPMFR